MVGIAGIVGTSHCLGICGALAVATTDEGRSVKSAVSMLVEQIVRLERRSGRRAVGVTVAMPLILDHETARRALEHQLDDGRKKVPDLEIIPVKYGGPRVLTVDFELDETD